VSQIIILLKMQAVSSAPKHIFMFISQGFAKHFKCSSLFNGKHLSKFMLFEI